MSPNPPAFRGSPSKSSGGGNLWLLAFIAACAVEKLLSIFATSLKDDESYTLVISRQLALSYFDHPPLHQWIAHGFVALFGESHASRLPFLAINLATSAALYGLTRRLFGASAALWAVVAFNATAYFLTLPDGFIMPDAPLLLFLVGGVWAVAEILYGDERPLPLLSRDNSLLQSSLRGALATKPSRGLSLWLLDCRASLAMTGVFAGREGRLWALAGVCFGLAGLSKYSALFAPLGLLGFLLGSPRHRRWLTDPRPYLGGLLALAVVSPALIWNFEHHWVSFVFQSNRAAARVSLEGRALVAILGGIGAQLASLTPWVAPPVVAGIWQARQGGADDGRRLLLWLAAPTLLYFALIPLLGQRAIPHWFNSGWLFAFPLAGLWLSERSAAFSGRWARWTAALSLVVVALYLAALGGVLSFLGAKDPTRYAHDWPTTETQRAFEAAGASFAIVDNWRVGGRLGFALGPDVPVCAFGSDPRGLAFACDTRRFVGANALAASENGSTDGPEFRRGFDAVERLGELAVGPTRRMYVFSKAKGLREAFPLPYGP